jgi:hypothetical protein
MLMKTLMIVTVILITMMMKKLRNHTQQITTKHQMRIMKTIRVMMTQMMSQTMMTNLNL